MTVLVAGASGATGRLLVTQLLERGESVKVIVRSADRLSQVLPSSIANCDNLSVVEASIVDLSDKQMSEHVRDCHAVASCLGHNLSFRGLFGPPYRLVTDATRRLSNAIAANQPTQPVRFVLMNTTGNRNRDLDEPISMAQTVVIGLLRLLLPPHADNEMAADFLRTQIGQSGSGPKANFIEWVVVRPDGLSSESAVTPYSLHPSPTRSAIFDAGTTSRINVGHFMAELITSEQSWNDWKGQMPVIYNKSADTKG